MKKKRKKLKLVRPEAEKIEVPEELKGDARKFWLKQSPHWTRLGLLNELTWPWFVIMSRTWGYIQYFEKELDELLESSNPNPNHLRKISCMYDSALSRFIRMEVAGKMTPKLRAELLRKYMETESA